ncbi:hypothetical protein RRG08_059573 [Elysia crispata]|uniref:Uncharacterized protein n=1 Tax=Elysia crispata TaxID=231223 RepID=A0AAE0YIJ5_9GAST|nr:hypothetical protein RRG08_059573 [Elysia crispata]
MIDLDEPETVIPLVENEPHLDVYDVKNTQTWEDGDLPPPVQNQTEEDDIGTEDAMESNGVRNGYQHFQVTQDSGWSWVVTLASHVICAMVGGLVYTGGVLLDDLQAEFDAPRSTVSLAASCMIGLYQMGGGHEVLFCFGLGFVVVS